MNTQKIVTRESIQQMINNAPSRANLEKLIGRALVVIFNNQTESEKQSNNTDKNNGVGFSGFDGESGCKTAKFYLKHGKLLDWQIENWTRPARKGSNFARITKYHDQLNAAAIQKLRESQQNKAA